MRWASKRFSIEQSDPRISLKKVDFLDGMCGSDCSIEKIGIEKALFRLRKANSSAVGFAIRWKGAFQYVCMSFCPEKNENWSSSPQNESELCPNLPRAVSSNWAPVEAGKQLWIDLEGSSYSFCGEEDQFPTFSGQKLMRTYWTALFQRTAHPTAYELAQECPISSPIRNRPFRFTDPTAKKWPGKQQKKCWICFVCFVLCFVFVPPPEIAAWCFNSGRSAGKTNTLSYC